MASSWSLSWSTSWGDSWGPISTDVVIGVLMVAPYNAKVMTLSANDTIMTIVSKETVMAATDKKTVMTVAYVNHNMVPGNKKNTMIVEHIKRFMTV